MEGRYLDSGDYDLHRLSIFTNTVNQVEIDLRPGMLDMTIYESIYTPIISGNVTVVDSTNMIKENAIGNGELIRISYNTSGIKTPVEYFGIVYKVSEPIRVTEHSTGQTIYFVSPEAFNSLKNRVFNGYTEDNFNIVNKLYEMMKFQARPKELNITPTKNIENYVFTGDTVLEAIDIVTKDSVSTADESGYVFYEDMEKFNFVPLEQLYKTDPVVEYAYKNSSMFDNPNNRAEESFNTYQDFELMPPTNYMQKTMDGEYGSSWAVFSTYTNTLNIIEYGASQDYDSTKSLGVGPQLSTLTMFHNPLNKLSIDYATDSETKFYARIKNTMTKLRSSTVVVSIGLFGDSTIRAGNVCKATIPNWSMTADSDSEPKDYISGKFLIAEIKHMFKQNLYTQRMKLVKDAYEVQS